jgi:hypothetical protein
LRKLIGTALILGFLLVDLFFFHDIFKVGEVTTLPQYDRILEHSCVHPLWIFVVYTVRISSLAEKRLEFAIATVCFREWKYK